MTNASSVPSKSALVAGAAGAVGAATCRELAQRGWRVFAGVRSEAAAAAIDPVGGRIVPLVFDITDEASLAVAAERVADGLGGAGLDGLVNSVGVIVRGPFELVPLSALRRQFEVNVVGQVALVQAFLPAVRRAGGRVVYVGGAAGRTTIPFLGPLSAAKAASEAVTDALRMELKHFGVAVSIVDPSHLYTEIFTKADAAAAREGYAGTDSVQELYAPALDTTWAAIAKQKRNPVDVGVRPIVAALTARRPKARYLAGRDARLLELLRHLPDGVRDRILMSNVGLRKELFSR